MANLNLQDKKFITPENLKLIVNYGLGFASRVKNLEDKEIAPFEADKMYIKDSLTIYDGYIYKAKTTNQSSTFNEIYWDKIGDDITELTLDEIKAMVGLTTEQLTTLSSIISDSEVRLDKTYSSSKIYSSIQDAIDTSKAYTLSELGKMSGASYKVVTTTNEMTDEKIIYLLNNGTTFDMYIIESETPTKIGDTNIDLSDCYTKNEIDNDFLKKTDATSTYATKTELNEKANDDEVVKKTDIKTTLDQNSTDDDVCSGKAIFNAIKKNCISYSTEEQLTGGTWIDGKPIYRQIYTSSDFDFIDNVQQGVSKTNISNIEDLVNISGRCKTPNYFVPVNVGRWHGDTGNVWSFSTLVNPNGQIILDMGASIYSAKNNIKIVVEYTKKTDA